MSNMFSMKESALIYLDRSGALKKLSEDCKAFKDPQQSEAVYRFSISVNPSDLIDVDPELGDCVLHDPLRAAALFQSVCFLAIKTLSLVEKICTESQVNVVLKLTHLPPFPEYTLDLCRFPRMCGSMRPVRMEGVVIAITRVTKYTLGAMFLCINKDCPCSTGFHHIRVHAPGATESATIRNDFSCMACSSPLKENVKFRVLGDKQLVEMIHANAINVLRGCQQSSVRYQSVTLILRDELCDSMAIGQLYRVIGIPAHVHQWPGSTCSVEANTVRLLEPEYPHTISANFQKLLRATAGSPWGFPAFAAHCFGLEITPPGLFNTLKLTLLLSLVQTRADTKNTFHSLDLLVATTDTVIPDRLMTYSLSLASRGVRHQTSGELFASLTRDEHRTGTANIHAGSAILATGGICMLGDLSCYKKDKLDALESVLESHVLSVFIPGKKYGEDVDQQLSLPVPCSFWALTNSTDNSRRSGRADEVMLGTAEMGRVPVQLADAFGLIVQCRDNAGALLAQTAHTLAQAVEPGTPLYPSFVFSSQEYKELMAYAQNLQVELSPEAQKMIHGYYMASRRIRSQSQGIKRSVASVKLLVSLAEAHCRLGLRTRVLEEDAVIAVLLCENSLTLKHGGSPLVIPPDAVFPCDLGDADGLQRRDSNLDDLHQNILHFIYAYAPGADTYIKEE